jgi:hypothetical protein
MKCDICNTLNIGCVPGCGVFNSNIILPVGVYNIIYSIDNIQHTYQVSTTEESEPLFLLMSAFPLNREILFYIVDQYNQRVNFVSESVTYDTFLMKTIIGSTDIETAPIAAVNGNETIDGTGASIYTPTIEISDTSTLLVIRDNITLVNDANLTRSNSYRVVNGDIELDYSLEVGSYIQVIQFLSI